MSSNSVTAPEPSKPQGATMQQFGTPGTFKGQKILNNPENGAFVNEQPRNNQPEQIVHQGNIAAAAAQQFRREHAEPAFSPIQTRDTGGIFTPDNSLFENVRFGDEVAALRATTAYLSDLTAVTVTIDGAALIATNRVLVKNGASPSKYTAARLATTGNVALATALEDGDTLDGVVIATGDRILVKDQTLPAENGIYVAQASGAAVRATDLDATAEAIFGKSITVTAGTVNTGKIFVVSVVPTTLGTDPLTFADTATPAGLTVIHAFDGVYVVGVVAGTAPLTRATDMDSAAELQGAVVSVTSGTVNSGKTFLEMATITTLGVSAANFADKAGMFPTAIVNKPGDNEKNSDSQVYAQA